MAATPPPTNGSAASPAAEESEDTGRSSSIPVVDSSGAELIAMVEPNPELYDKRHPLYCNNAHKGVLWTKIAKKLGGNPKKTREQFSYMRKRFKSEYEARKKGLRRPLAPDPDSANYRQPLFHYEQLSFLEPCIDFEQELETAGNNAEGTDETLPPLSLLESFKTDPGDSTSASDTAELFKACLNDVVTVPSSSGPETGVSAAPAAPVVTGSRKRKSPTPAVNSVTQVTAPSDATLLRSISQASNSNFQPGGHTVEPNIVVQLIQMLAESVDQQQQLSQQQQNQNQNQKFPDQLPQPPTTPNPQNSSNGGSQNGQSNQVLVPRTQEDTDECKLFGKQISYDLSTLSRRHRILARCQITEVIMGYIVKEENGEF